MKKSSSTKMNKTYFSVIQLLDACGPWYERLDQTYRIVNDPDFTYSDDPLTLFLPVTLANSSYWLDKELFDASIVKKNRSDKSLNGSQQCHLYLLDIGSVLMDKGFPLNQETIDHFVPKDSPLYSWAKNFLIQCRARHAWLKKRKLFSTKNNLTYLVTPKIH